MGKLVKAVSGQIFSAIRTPDTIKLSPVFINAGSQDRLFPATRAKIYIGIFAIFRHNLSTH
jgi:hypothetical protein